MVLSRVVFINEWGQYPSQKQITSLKAYSLLDGIPTSTSAPPTSAPPTSSPTPTVQSTQTINNNVCSAGHTLEAAYFMYNYSQVQASWTNWGGEIIVRANGQGDTNYIFDTVGGLSNSSGTSGFCWSNGGDDPCTKVQQATGYSMPSRTNYMFAPQQINSFSIQVGYSESATVTVFEYGYLCHGDGSYYVVRNSGGVTHSFGVTNPYASWTGDIVESECHPKSIRFAYDLAALGSLTAGSLTAAQISNEPSPAGTLAIDATLSYTLPVPVSGSGSGSKVDITYHVSASQSYIPLPSAGIITLNGGIYSMDGLTSVSIAPGTTSLTARFEQQYDGSLGPVVLDHLILTISVDNPLGNGILNCDGGMELEEGVTPWDKADTSLQFGRLLSDWTHFTDPFDGVPACGIGMQVVGYHPPIAKLLNIGTQASDAFEYFTATGGTVYYKFRYRSAGLWGMYANSPNIYLTQKESGALVMDLIGSPGQFDATLVKSDWTLVTGEISLSAGNYGVNLAAALPETAVYFDDVYFSTRPWLDDKCTNEFAVPDELALGPTATPTVTGSPTPTGTLEFNSTMVHTTATATITLQSSVTLRPSTTPRNTYTPGASFTPRPTSPRGATMTPGASTATYIATWATATVWTTLTPLPTNNPAFTATPIGGIIESYSWIPSLPLCITCLPNTWAWPANPDPSNPIVIRYDPWRPAPPSAPLPPGYVYAPWTGDPNQDCRKPAGWDMIKVNLWLDYETCVMTSFVSFTPQIASTAVAIPKIFEKYEPFGTIKEFTDGAQQVRTQVASYPWNGSQAASGVNDTINPMQPLKGTSGCGDPWAGQLDLGNPACGANIASYNDGCSARIATLLGNPNNNALTKGTCFVFGVTRNIGVLPWMQFLINIAALLMPIRTAFTVIGMRTQIAGVVSTVATYQDRRAQ